MEKITFIDDSYIEKNTSGFLYVGEIAHKFMHLINRYGITSIEELKKISNINKLTK